MKARGRPPLTWRQRLASAGAVLAVLIAIEVALGARGAKPHERPFYYVSYAVEWLFVKGSGKLGSGLGWLIYAVYLAGAWVVRLTGPTLWEALYEVVVNWFFSWLWALEAFFKSAFEATGMSPAEADGLTKTLGALTVAGAGLIFFIRQFILARQEHARRSLAAVPLPPPPPPPRHNSRYRR